MTSEWSSWIGEPGAGERAAPPAAAPVDAAWLREIHPDAVLLFRYSALTFNGHRIHYGALAMDATATLA